MDEAGDDVMDEGEGTDLDDDIIPGCYTFDIARYPGSPVPKDLDPCGLYTGLRARGSAQTRVSERCVRIGLMSSQRPNSPPITSNNTSRSRTWQALSVVSTSPIDA
jgi:hypothetical protein